MNRAELLVYVLALATLAIYCRRVYSRWSTVFLLTILAAPPVYVALQGTSQFLTVDENFYVHELAGGNRHDFVIRELSMGAFRTSLSVLAPVLCLLPHSTEWPNTLATEVLKLSHWLTGFGCWLWLVHLLGGMQPKLDRRLTFGLGLVILILPVSLMGFKTFNYDVLSMYLGIIAVLLMIQALAERDVKAAWWSILVATLAAQEKLISSPLALAAVCTYVAVSAEPRSFSRIARRLLGGFAWAYGLSLASVLFLSLMGGLRAHELLSAPAHALTPFVIWGWGVLRFSFGITDFAAYSSLLVMLAVAVCMVGSGILVLAMLPRFEPWRQAATRWLVPVLFVGVFAAFALGVWGNAHVRPYWAPYRPIGPDEYRVEQGEINGALLHFGAADHASHIRSFMAYGGAVFLDATPSAVWLLWLVLLLAPKGREQVSRQPLLAAFALLCFFAPLVYGVLQVNLSHRYVNLFLAGATVSVLALGAAWWQTFRPGLRWAVPCGALLLVGFEIVPFLPLGAAFRPAWVEYADAHSPKSGHMNPSWVGWGEEMMIVGEKLAQRTPVAGEGAPRLYCCYWSGAWIQRGAPLEQILLRTVPDPAKVRYGANDWFVINRSCVVQGMNLPDIEPEFVYSCRGFDMAWVYRGSRLREAGIHYLPQHATWAKRTPAERTVDAVPVNRSAATAERKGEQR
jgi:hypothetical protein